MPVDNTPYRARRVAPYKHWGPMRPDEPFRLQQHHNKSQRGVPHEETVPTCAHRSSFILIFTRGGRRRQSASSPTFKTASAGPQHTPSDFTPPPPMWCAQHHAPHISVIQKLQDLCPALLQVNVDPCTGAGRHLYVTSVATSHSTNEEPTRRMKNPPALLSLATRTHTYEGSQRHSPLSTHTTHHTSVTLDRPN